jgi:hypothetical protein
VVFDENMYMCTPFKTAAEGMMAGESRSLYFTLLLGKYPNIHNGRENSAMNISSNFNIFPILLHLS